MSLEINSIYCGDARDLMEDIEEESVACSVWSPPYHVGKEYEKDIDYEEWKSLLQEVIRLHEPVLEPGGFMVVNIADILCFPDEEMPQFQALNVGKRRCSVTREDVLEAMEEHPDYNRYEIADLLGCSEQTVDRRLNGNNIRGGKHQTQTRVKVVGGMIEEMALDAGLYLYDRRIWKKDPAWVNSQWTTSSYRAVDEFEYLYMFWKPGVTKIDRNKLSKDEWSEWGSRAVWEIRSVRSNDDHEAKFPLELPRRVIKLLSFEDDVVLDPFIGSGTTAVAAIEEGRNYIGIDKEEKYAKMARSSCEDVVSKAKRSDSEQLSLELGE
jgi:site-specific DNA-methyltransferase (adenine-specific)